MSHAPIQVIERKNANTIKEINKSLKDKLNLALLEKKAVTGKVLPESKWTNGSVDGILGHFVRKEIKKKINRIDCPDS